jgi:hypothetical protein
VRKDCNSCRTIQWTVASNFPNVLRPVETSDLRDDIDRIHEQHYITEPVYTRKRVIIGRVEGNKKKEEGEDVVEPDEDIVVMCWSTNQYPNYSLGFEAVERQCIAQTLERFFGAPLYFDTVQYHI